MSLLYFSRNFVVFLCTTLSLVSVSSDCSAQIQELGFLPNGGRNSIAFDVSDDGSTVAGRSLDSTGDTRATVWKAETGFQLLEGLANDYEGVAFSNSNDGKVIVTSPSEGQGIYRWTEETGAVQVLGPDGELTSGGSVSGNGEVVVGISSSRAFRWAGDGNVIYFEPQPSGLSSQAKATSFDGSVAVGIIFETPNFQKRAFRWTEGTGIEMLENFSGDVDSDATAISDDGSVIVGDITIDGNSTRDMYRWTEEPGLVGLGWLSDLQRVGFAEAVSGDGSVVGGFGMNDSGVFEATLWTEETGVVSLYDHLEEAGHDVSHWSRLTRVYGISADGSFAVGSGFNQSGQSEGFLVRLGTAVPEPNSMLMLLAFSPMLLTRRHRS
jgi:uncharacterized membrane protein